MRQKFLWILWALAGGCACAPLGQAAVLVPQTVAARYGLVRAWTTQVGSQRTIGKIAHANYDEGLLLVQSTRNLLTALDGETGRAVWSTQVGPTNHLSTEPAANDKHVVVVNGSVLYVLDRASGHILWQRQLGGVPGAGPGISHTHAFVPMVSGLIEGYDLEKGARFRPWVYKSKGRVLIPPMTTNQSLSWATEHGYFYVADPAAKGIRFRLETRGAIHARPAYWTPNLFACSTDGYVYAVDEATGKIDWRFSAGDAVYQSPVAIEGRVFVVSEGGGMFCLDGKSGTLAWRAPKITQFVSTSPTRVYACDDLGRLAVLDAKTGSRLAAMPLDGISLKVVNTQSDRVYLASDEGIVQCLREADLKSPVMYSPPPPPEPEDPFKPKRPAGKPLEKAETAEEPSADEPADAGAMEDKKPDEPAGDESADPFK